MSRRLLIRIALLLFGVALLAAFVWLSGPEQVGSSIRAMGWGFAWLLLPSAAWRVLAATGMWVLVNARAPVGWWPVLLIRSAGEAVNTLTPLANLGGEPLKAMLLKRHLGGTVSAGFVVIDKTVFYLATALFMGSGLAVGAFVLARHPATLAASAGVTILLLAGLVWVIRRQARGDLAVAVVRLLRVVRIRPKPKTLARIEEVDRAMHEFWASGRARFVVSLILHFLGRALRTVDVWLCVYFLGLDISWSAAYFVAAVGMLANTVFTFIPGALGASEGGHAFVFEAIGLGAAAGVAVGLIRRIRTYALAGASYLIVVFYPDEKKLPRQTTK